MWHAFSKINGGARIRSPSSGRMLHAGISFLLVLPLFCWLGRISRPFPRSSPSAPLSVSQLPIPAETPRVSATPSLRGFAGETVPHPLPRTDSRECWPMAIHLRRSFLRYRPSASRSGRGVTEESLTWLRPASRTHEPGQQVGTPRVATTDPKIGSQCSASKDNWGRLPTGCAVKVPLRCRSPRLIRRRAWKVEEKVRAFLPDASILPASAGRQAESRGRAEVLIPFRA